MPAAERSLAVSGLVGRRQAHFAVAVCISTDGSAGLKFSSQEWTLQRAEGEAAASPGVSSPRPLVSAACMMSDVHSGVISLPLHRLGHHAVGVTKSVLVHYDIRYHVF